MKILKILLQVCLIIFVPLVVFGILYVLFSPQTGGKSTTHASNNFKNGKFQNMVPTSLSVGVNTIFKMTYAFLFEKDENAYPKSALPTVVFDDSVTPEDNDVHLTWFGHSTVLLKIGSTTILTDPVFNNKRLPPFYMGPKPFPYENTYSIHDLPTINFVLISHDHYDHLDMETIQQLKGADFHVPLGVKTHLVKWGINSENVTEYDWYEDKIITSNVHLRFAPSRHFSGRGPLGRNKTLWGSWIMQVHNKRVYFSGDSGYFDEFKKIGDTYGPFDIALLDSGQYNNLWSTVHMLPNEVARAGEDLQAKAILPIHWGKYVLSLHSWSEPVQQVLEHASKNNQYVTTPKIGETINLNKKLPNEIWW